MDLTIQRHFRNPSDEFCAGVRYVIPSDFDPANPALRSKLTEELTAIYDSGYRLLEMELKIRKNTPAACEAAKLVYRTANQLGLIVDYRLDWPETLTEKGHACYLVNGVGCLTMEGGTVLKRGTILPPARETKGFLAGSGKLFAVLAVRTEVVDGIRYQRECRVLPLSDIQFQDYLRSSDGDILFDGMVNPLTKKVRQSINTCTYVGEDLTIGAPGEQWDIRTYYLDRAVSEVGPFVQGSVFLIVDYYSKTGAEDFVAFYESGWDETLKRLIRENGGYMTSDGGDHNQPVVISTWSEELLDKFRDLFHYDLMDYLPVQFSGYALENDSAERINNDYYHALSELFCGFNQYVEDWAKREYGVHYRAQIGYSTDLDTQRVVQSIGQTDVESLWCQDQIGSYLSMTTVTDLMRNKPVSIEVGAMGRGYGCTWRRLLTEINTSMIAGVNKMIFHVASFPISADCTWPGYTCFGSQLADWGTISPQFLDSSVLTKYVDRAQYVIRNGTTKRDLAVYSHIYEENAQFFNMQDSLTNAGYTFGVFSPAAMKLQNARCVENGMIDPDGAGYRAFIIRNPLQSATWDHNPLGVPTKTPIDEMGFGEIPHHSSSGIKRIPINTLETILSYAENGVPIIVIGELPTHSEGFSEIANQKDDTVILENLWSKIKDTGKLFIVETEDCLPAMLREIGIAPRLFNPEDSCIRSYQCVIGSDRYYFLYNMEGETAQTFSMKEHAVGHPKDLTQDVILEGCGCPQNFDLWSGDILPMSYEQIDAEHIRVRITLHAGETMLIRVGGSYAPACINTYTAEKIVPDDWTLEIERWMPKNPYGETGIPGIATEKVLLPQVHLTEPKAWKDVVPEGENISGVGTYSCSFQLADTADGLNIQLGTAFDMVRMWLDGEEIPVNQLAYCAYYRDKVYAGEHKLRIQTASTLQNQAAALGKYRMPAPDGGFHFHEEVGVASYGICGNVVIEAVRATA